ncbi:CHASE2 domain-containing protein [Castellaniella ginsengisoli]|uniref:Adenylate/guanylate cyclase domain-containing protein n=1 Tax=Castellaniella ginsengisoli TaxID=546114 RepID=A0AB39DBZ9_9BURK
MLWQAQAFRQPDRGGPLNRLDAVLYDWRFEMLPPQREAVLPIVIIDLDEATQQREGRWPWDRAKVAQLIQALRERGAALIGFDVVFSEPGPNPVRQMLQAGTLPAGLQSTLAGHAEDFDGDAILARTLDPFVLLGFFLHADGGDAGQLPAPFMVLPPEVQAATTIRALPDYTSSLPQLIAAGAGSGFVVAIPDPDGVVRRMPMILRHGADVYPALSLEMARLALGAPWLRLEQAGRGDQQVATGILIGRHVRVPVDERGDLLVPYRGRAGSFPTISATGVLRGDAPPERLAILQDALVLVGTSALGLADLRTTPLQTGYPGVEAHANVLDALLQAALGRDVLYVQPDWTPGVVLILMLVLGLVLALGLPGRSLRCMVSYAAACLLALGTLNGWAWDHQHMALPLAAPTMLVMLLALLNLIGGYVAANRQKRAIQTLFGEYVPAVHVARMVARPDQVSQAGELRDMTVLFADVRNFTATSEHLSAGELKTVLNRYLTAVTEAIFEHQGTIDKYVGDLVMAFWNAPLDDPDHADHAVRAALAMQERLAVLRAAFQAEGLPALKMGIGLNTGPMNVGDMGSRYRRAYTVLGDAVNLGSRLEGLTAFYGVPILVSDHVRRLAPRFAYRLVDRVRVKGRRGVLDISQPLAALPVADAALMERATAFEQAVLDYRARRWEAARAAFSALAAQWPEDQTLCGLYLERMAAVDPADLPADWDVVHDHVHK